MGNDSLATGSTSNEEDEEDEAEGKAKGKEKKTKRITEAREDGGRDCTQIEEFTWTEARREMQRGRETQATDAAIGRKRSQVCERCGQA
ncbi:hypothetical protein Cni_G16030 [Canna indica]|uniref:Uncharacterized protein n=1 Tax=Canna indica TaxID=4628 RepID=A0AAQ3QGD8_9LILI|nr:hypothetical protein Cni_G16030 [Canna indica]